MDELVMKLEEMELDVVCFFPRIIKNVVWVYKS